MASLSVKRSIGTLFRFLNVYDYYNFYPLLGAHRVSTKLSMYKTICKTLYQVFTQGSCDRSSEINETLVSLVELF